MVALVALMAMVAVVAVRNRPIAVVAVVTVVALVEVVTNAAMLYAWTPDRLLLSSDRLKYPCHHVDS